MLPGCPDSLEFVQASEQSDALGHRLLPQSGQIIIMLDESGNPISFLMSFSLMHL
jgi:hypothetical protein